MCNYYFTPVYKGLRLAFMWEIFFFHGSPALVGLGLLC